MHSNSKGTIKLCPMRPAWHLFLCAFLNLSPKILLTVFLWCLKTASIILELPSHKRQVNGVKFSPDAKRVVSCGSDFFMKVIDLRTGSILFSKGNTTIILPTISSVKCSLITMDKRLSSCITGIMYCAQCTRAVTQYV